MTDEQRRAMVQAGGNTGLAVAAAILADCPDGSARRMRTFDWDAAARLIVAAGPDAGEVEAGLSQNWGYTGGTVFRDGKPVTDCYTYLSSWWAIPTVRIGDAEMPCWRWEDETDGWTCSTKWPQSALAIIEGGSGGDA